MLYKIFPFSAYLLKTEMNAYQQCGVDITKLLYWNTFICSENVYHL